MIETKAKMGNYHFTANDLDSLTSHYVSWADSSNPKKWLFLHAALSLTGLMNQLHIQVLSAPNATFSAI